MNWISIGSGNALLPGRHQTGSPEQILICSHLDFKRQVFSIMLRKMIFLHEIVFYVVDFKVSIILFIL